jgi:putative transposase
MPRVARIVIPDYPHHITQRGCRRQRTFFDDSDYLAYLGLLRSLKDEAGVDVLAYCLMPNHVHLVAIPRDKHSLAKLFGVAHHRYARRVNSNHDWRGHLWQERFYSFVMDEDHFLAAVRYVELNPVRAGLSDRPDGWRWSSVHAHLGNVSDPLVATAPTLEQISDWQRFLSQDCPVDQFDDIRKHTRTGRPAGDEEFIRELEGVTGRRLRPRKPGPKPSSIA